MANDRHLDDELQRMVLRIDALRWGQSDLHSLVPDGDRRRLWGGKGGD